MVLSAFFETKMTARVFKERFYLVMFPVVDKQYVKSPLFNMFLWVILMVHSVHVMQNGQSMIYWILVESYFMQHLSICNRNCSLLLISPGWAIYLLKMKT